MGDKKNYAEVAQTIQALATVAALLIGGIWTYRLFVLQRLAYPHLKIEHSVSDIPLPDNRILLVVDITHSNPGNVQIALPSGQIKIYALQALPEATTDQLQAGQASSSEDDNSKWELVDRHEWRWNTAAPLIIEPGESNQLHSEFVLDGDVGPLEIYSYFKNPAIQGKEIGWSLTSIYHPGHSSEGARKIPIPTKARAPSGRSNAPGGC
jgi:hypothetical protein